MTFPLARPITPDEVHTFHHDGVVHLRGVLDLRAVNRLRRDIDAAIATLHTSRAGYDFTELAGAYEANDQQALAARDHGQHDVTGTVAYLRTTGKPLLYDDVGPDAKGHFFIDTGVTARIASLRKFTLKGATAEIAGALLGSNEVRFFGDQIFVKEPGTKERTAFHQDAPYFNIDGDQCCVQWITCDPVAAENGMLYIRGSHRDRTIYKPNTFVSQAPLPGADGLTLPDIEGHLGEFDVVQFDVEPGDVVVHHYRLIHGARGNRSRYQVRRTLSARYCGDDIRVKLRPAAPAQLHLKEPLVEGARLGDVDFPVVWRMSRDQAAA